MPLSFTRPSNFTIRAIASVILGSGLNSNIAIPSSDIIVNGPTGAFSLGGFIMTPSIGGNIQGTTLRAYINVGFPITVVNEDTSSTAANRINTTIGADYLLPHLGGILTFFYISGRWALESCSPV